MNKHFSKEARLISLCKKGDLMALGHIAGLHRDFLYQTALALLGDQDAASSLVIVTAVRFWNDRRVIRPDTSLKTYFFDSL
jgi:DNA-directed RNA polymerase specialized sigma24 family protein